MDAVDTTIGRARVTGWPDSANALAARLAVAHALAGVDLLPPGLPPAAVLIVRQLPAPGGRRPALRPGGRIDPAWERAARGSLADLASIAVRPWNGPAPPDCPAVLFHDEAELLACLALEIALGRAGDRWWWQAVRGRWRWASLAQSALPAVLLDQPALLPAVLRLLHRRGQAVEVVQRLAPAEASQALRAMCGAYAIEPPGAAATGSQAAPERAPADTALAGREPPWLPWLPAGELPVTLAPERICLLGVGLTLAQAPAVARRPAFREGVERWLRAQRAAAGREGPRLAPAPAGLPGAAFRVDATAAPAEVAPGEAPTTDQVATVQAGKAVAPGAQTPSEALHGASSVGGETAQPQPGSPDVAPLELAGAETGRRPTVAQRDLAEAAVQSAEAQTHEDLAPEGVATELGGVLFLINVMQQLDLPDCFEPDWQFVPWVGPWGLLELLGRALLLDIPQAAHSISLAALAADPLWAVLAALDGRPRDEVAGARFEAPDHLTIPAAWSRWLGPGAHTARRIALETVAPLDGPLLAGVSVGLRRWLAVVTPLLRKMLAAALGGLDDGATALLLRRGKLYVTSSHVDLVLPLESGSLPVRMAGLDFDPGWLPAFGRVVKFHYR